MNTLAILVLAAVLSILGGAWCVVLSVRCILRLEDFQRFHERILSYQRAWFEQAAAPVYVWTGMAADA